MRLKDATAQPFNFEELARKAIEDWSKPQQPRVWIVSPKQYDFLKRCAERGLL